MGYGKGGDGLIACPLVAWQEPQREIRTEAGKPGPHGLISG